MFTKTVIVVLVFLISFQVSFAVYGQQPFGGKRIINTKAIEIKTYEDAGFVCPVPVPGTTIEILSIKGPTSYFIPASVTSKSRITPNIGQKIMGLYFGKTLITCYHPSGSVKDVILPNIIMFGNSKI